MIDRRSLRIAILALLAAPACGQEKGPSIPVGLLLSYSGSLAANSVNSERALFEIVLCNAIFHVPQLVMVPAGSARFSPRCRAATPCG